MQATIKQNYQADVTNMRVSVEITSRFGRRLNIVVPTEEIDRAVKSRTERIAGTIRMKGFRQGKVPVSIVEKMHGAAIRGEVADEILKNSLRKAFEQEKLTPATVPTVQTMKLDAGQPMEFTVTFEVAPEVAAPDVSKLTVEKWIVDINDNDVEKILEQIRKQAISWQEVTRPAELGDKITGNLQGFKDGQPDPKAFQKNIDFLLNEETIKKGLTPLQHAKLGDEVEFDLSPNDQQTVSTPLHFRIRINKIEAPILPELDEKFAERFGIKEGGMDALRSELRQRLTEQAEQKVKQHLKKQIMDKLVEQNVVEFPQSMIDEEYKRLKNQMLTQAKNQSPNTQELSLTSAEENELQSTARKQVILGLLLPAVVKEKGIVVDEAVMFKRLNSFRNALENSDDVFKMMAKDKNFLSYFRAAALEEQVVEEILKEVQLIEKKMNYSQLMELPEPHENLEEGHVHTEDCHH
jgi:trigger factor